MNPEFDAAVNNVIEAVKLCNKVKGTDMRLGGYWESEDKERGRILYHFDIVSRHLIHNKMEVCFDKKELDPNSSIDCFVFRYAHIPDNIKGNKRIILGLSYWLLSRYYKKGSM